MGTRACRRLVLPLFLAAAAAASAVPPAVQGLRAKRASVVVTAAPGAPEQLKLSLAGAPATSMVVSWISKDAVPTDGSCFDRPLQVWSPDGDQSGTGPGSGSSPPTPFPFPLKTGCALAGSEVRYGQAPGALSSSQINASLLFADHDVDANDNPTNVSTPRTVHVVVLSGLQPATRYHYQVRSAGGPWSAIFPFRTMAVKADTLSLLITADVGASGLPPSAVKDAMQGRFDMHLHAGDIAYDMPVNHGATGDLFSNQLSNISRSIPFQAWPGNHETDDNHCDFLNYRARFFNQNLTADTATNARGPATRAVRQLALLLI